MCQAAMQELTAALKQSKEHKARITISVSLQGLKLKDEKGTVGLSRSFFFDFCFNTRDSGKSREGDRFPKRRTLLAKQNGNMRRLS